MNSILIHLKKFDWTLIGSAILLTIAGLISIYSSSVWQNDFLNFQKQLIFFAVALCLMFLFSFLDWRVLREGPYLILSLYFLACLALIGLFWLAPTIRGIRSWYKIGFLSIDPIEYTKIILIFLLAKYFSMRHTEMYRIQHIFLSGLYIALPFSLIFLQPDLGSALILLALWIGVLIISGIEVRHFFLLVLCFILLATFGWNNFLKDYQKLRILSFLTPQADPLGASWSQTQSKIAIGSGGIFGQGFCQGSQTQYGFLTEPQTDFIFASLAEEFGLFGVIVLLSLFLILIWRILKIAVEARNNFVRLFASGLSIIFLTEIFIHIGMNIGVLPIIGISLPLVSYGGSGLIAGFIAIGILQNMRNN
ncbi:MAG: FtsW/RodA/SpoVE family cell cycle protein [Patescibacteria group bacterium]